MGQPAPIFRSRAQTGYLPDIEADRRRVRARKRIGTVEVRFATADGTVRTREGVVHVRTGDAIVIDGGGDRWRVSNQSFERRYRPIPPTHSGQPGRYESLPNEVLAIAMDGPFDVVLRDGISQLHGNRGDWLVDYGDGNLGIVAAEVFEATYEILR
jgi:PGDYG protein